MTQGKNHYRMIIFPAPPGTHCLHQVPCSRRRVASQAAGTAPLQSGISVRGQRWAAVHRNSLQQFSSRMSFRPPHSPWLQPPKLCQVQAFACNAPPKRHKPLAQRWESLKTKIRCNPIIVPLLHSVSRPLLTVFGAG